jgi:sulfite reductase alpha subunit-like flavoprotein
MEIIKYKSCNNRVRFLIIPIYSITNYELNSTLTITIQQIIQLLWQHNNKIYSITSKQKNSRLTIKINQNN